MVVKIYYQVSIKNALKILFMWLDSPFKYSIDNTSKLSIRAMRRLVKEATEKPIVTRG